MVFLTARDGIEDKISGLTLGGDDYITAVPVRGADRQDRGGAATRGAIGAPVQDGRISYADLIMDEDSHLARRQDEQIDLSPTEFALPRYLLHNAGRVLSRAQILDHVWSYDFGGDSSVVDSYIRYLRKKVDVFSPPLIQTVRGVGYTLRVPSTRP